MKIVTLCQQKYSVPSLSTCMIGILYRGSCRETLFSLTPSFSLICSTEGDEKLVEPENEAPPHINTHSVFEGVIVDHCCYSTVSCSLNQPGKIPLICNIAE